MFLFVLFDLYDNKVLEEDGLPRKGHMFLSLYITKKVGGWFCPLF